jgi:chloramphenicol-sensitive protein RarD
MNRGILYGLSAYFLWGIFPIFWKMLQAVPAIEIVAQRVLWSSVILFVVLLASHKLGTTAHSLRAPRTLFPVAAASLFLMTNWLVYIWAVNAGRVVDTSLGYFMNPLVNVLLGVIFLKERMRSLQWAAIGIAAAGVLWLTIQYGSLPWIGLTLAFSFGFYGLLKKLSSLDAIQGLSAEMALLVIPMLLLLASIYSQPGRPAVIMHPVTVLLLMFTGVATVGPLLLFGAAARSIPLTVLGLIQYIAPTIQFLLGVLLFKEPFSAQLLVGFVLIWIALATYTVEGLTVRRRRAKAALAMATGQTSVSN